MLRLTDPNFRYTSSVETDLRKTFARIRREQRAADKQPNPAAAAPTRDTRAVVPMKARSK